MNYNKYIGIDAHKKYCVIHIIDVLENKQTSQKVETTREALIKALQGCEDAIAVIESTYNWVFVYDIVEELVKDIKLANPKQLKAISAAKIKTDKVDAKLLAKLLKADMIPEVYVSTEGERNLKDVLRYRERLIQERTRLKNRIHSYMARYGYSTGYSDSFGVKGIEEILNFDWPEPVGSIVLNQLEMIEDINSRISEVEKRLKLNLKRDIHVKLLNSIPGIGLISANLIACETGPISRFPRIKQYISYCGLAPGIRSSGGKTVYTRSKDRNKYLQSIFIEAAFMASSKSPVLKDKYESLSQRKGPNKARVAVARRLAEAAFKVLSKRCPFQEGITLRSAAPSICDLSRT